MLYKCVVHAYEVKIIFIFRQQQRNDAKMLVFVFCKQQRTDAKMQFSKVGVDPFCQVPACVRHCACA